MKLILTQEVTGLCAPGDVVEVKDGYGRNYLVPRGVDAIRKFATAAPEGVKRSSGSSTRLPTTVMTVSPAMWVS